MCYYIIYNYNFFYQMRYVFLVKQQLQPTPILINGLLQATEIDVLQVA